MPELSEAKLNIPTTSDGSMTGHQEPELGAASTHTRKGLQPPRRTCVGHDVDLPVLLFRAGVATQLAAML